MQLNDTIDVVRRACDGDREAWESIVEQYSPLLWSVTRRFRLDRDQRADAVQETWVQLYQHIGRIRDPSRLAGWLATTTRNNCLAVIRRTKRERTIAETYREVETDDPSPEEHVVRFERRQELRRALRRLPSREQTLLRLLAESPPPSYQDISRELGMPIGSIGPSRRRALDHLRQELANLHSASF